MDKPNTNTPPTTNNASKGASGPGKKKPKRRSRPKRRVHQRPRGPPPAPQTKVILRNLGLHCNIPFTVKELIKRANEKLSDDGKIELNEVAFDNLLKIEEAARLATEAERVKLQQKAQKKEQDGGEAQSTATEQESESTQQQQQDDSLAKELQQLSMQSEVTPLTPPSGVAARVLYTVAPKKTRHRGDKPGCVYIMLTSSRIEPRESDAASQSSQPSNRSVVDYARDVAERRLILHKALQALQSAAIEDAKAKQEFDGCEVLEAPNAKTWKPIPMGANNNNNNAGSNNNNNNRNRLEGTIFQSPDYLEFLEQKERQKQERMARPKPMPGGGGGMTNLTNLHSTSENNLGDSTNINNSTNEGPIAAIVLHLRAKQEAEKRRKQAKRRTAKKGAATNSTKKDGDATAREPKGTKPKKKNKKSKKKTVSPNVTSVLNK